MSTHNTDADRFSRAKRIVDKIRKEGHLPVKHPAFDHQDLTGADSANDDAEVFIVAEHPGALAALSIFKPERLVEMLLARIDEMNAKAEITAISQRQSQMWKVGDLITREATDKLAQAATIFFINNLFGKLDEMIFEHVEETLMLAERLQETGIVKEFRKDGEWAEVHLEADTASETADRVIKYTSEVRKRRLVELMEKMLFPGQLQTFAAAYDDVLPVWQNAKKICADNIKRDWEGYVAHEYPSLPGDLVRRLSGNQADLTEDERTKIAEKGGDSSPSNIAIEHAARLCGAKNYEYTKSYLFSLLKQGRELVSAAVN